MQEEQILEPEPREEDCQKISIGLSLAEVQSLKSVLESGISNLCDDIGQEDKEDAEVDRQEKVINHNSCQLAHVAQKQGISFREALEFNNLISSQHLNLLKDPLPFSCKNISRKKIKQEQMIKYLQLVKEKLRPNQIARIMKISLARVYNLRHSCKKLPLQDQKKSGQSLSEADCRNYQSKNNKDVTVGNELTQTTYPVQTEIRQILKLINEGKYSALQVFNQLTKLLISKQSYVQLTRQFPFIQKNINNTQDQSGEITLQKPMTEGVQEMNQRPRQQMEDRSQIIDKPNHNVFKIFVGDRMEQTVKLRYHRVKQLISNRKKLSVCQIRKLLKEQFNLGSNQSTVAQTLKNILAQLKGPLAFPLQNEPRRKIKERLKYVKQIAIIPDERLFFIDKLTICFTIVKLSNQRCKLQISFDKPAKDLQDSHQILTVLLVLQHNKVLQFRILPRESQEQDFIELVSKLVDQDKGNMLNIGQTGTIVLDGVRFKQFNAVKELAESHKYRIVWCPSIFPNLNPLERILSRFKQTLSLKIPKRVQIDGIRNIVQSFHSTMLKNLNSNSTFKQVFKNQPDAYFGLRILVNQSLSRYDQSGAVIKQQGRQHSKQINYVKIQEEQSSIRKYSQQIIKIEEGPSKVQIKHEE